MNRRIFALTSAAALAAFALGACTQKAAEAATPASAPPSAVAKANDAYEMASHANGFAIGAPMAANTVYVFFDPTCPHCAHLWGSSKPLLGKLRMVWIPVGLLRQTSGPQGATILSAPDPAAAMAENEAAVLDSKGGIAVDPALKPDMLAKVKANTDLFTSLGADSVPLIVYRNARTGEHGSVSGSMDAAQLAAMVGV